MYNSRIIERFSFLMLSFFEISDLYIINPVSMDFLLDKIYVKRPPNSYITLFLKNIYLLQPVLLDNT